MSNVVAFPDAANPMDGFVRQLNISQNTLKGEKTPLNVYREVAQYAECLPIVAMDHLTQTDNQIHFAGTFEGAAALCSKFIVHDCPQLSQFGGAFFDGHAVIVSQSELNTQMSKGEDSVCAWLRDGCAACAAQALGLERPTNWMYVDSKRLRPVMEALGATQWDANPPQDAYRYASAIEKLSGNVPVFNVPVCVLDGATNKQWGTVLSAWDEFHTSAEWNILRTNKAGPREIGRLLGKTLNPVTWSMLDERFVHLLVRTFSEGLNGLNEDDKIAIARPAAEAFTTKKRIVSMVNALSTFSNEIVTMQRRESNQTWHNMLARCHYAQFLDSKDPADQIVALATYINCAIGNPDQLKQLLMDKVSLHSYTKQQMNILAQYQPQTLQHIDLPNPDDGTMVYNLLEAMLCVVNPPSDKDISSSEYLTLLTTLTEKGWAGFNVNLTSVSTQDTWVKLVMLMEIKGKSAEDHLPSLIAAAQQYNPHFASELCAALMRNTHSTPTTVQTVIEAGVNWNHVCNEKSLAEWVFANPNMPLPIKTQARRALQETGLGENIVPFAKNK